MEEKKAIREVDRAYWLPLKAELERCGTITSLE